MTKARVECKSLTKVYKPWALWSKKKNLKAVDNVNFSIKEGEVYSLLGPNGAGKSTIIKMIAGLISPTSGEILFSGRGGRGAKGAYRHLSAILEGPRNVYWRLSPLENLHYFGNLRGIPSSEIEDKAEKLLKFLDIEGKKKNQSQHLSRGMLQKLALAVALITDPELLLLDEPTLGLDVASARKIKDLIKDKAYNSKKGVLLTTHQMDLVEEVSDRIGIIKNGKLIAEGSVSELKKLFSVDVYQIRIRDNVKKIPRTFKTGLAQVRKDEGNILFRLSAKKHSDIYDALDELKRLKAEILDVRRDSEDMEEIFLRLTSKAEG